MARVVHRRKSGGAFSIIPLILFIFFVAGDDLLFWFFEGIFNMTGLIALAFPIFILIGIIKLIKNISGKDTTKNTNITSSELLNSLSSHFAGNMDLEVTNGVRIVCTDRNNSKSLKSYDIFMDDEYISDLEVFSNAYPGGFGNFSKLVVAKTTPKKLSKKEQKEMQKKQEEIQNLENALKKTTTVFEKDCAYFINSINKLNDKIPKERITEGLNQTVTYLKEIQRIENEFPESKEKTKKLYQYYLPMLTDILENYHRLESNTTVSEEFLANEDRLCKTIILINGALKTISSSLLEEYYTDLKVDMKTLESILKKDGLIDSMEDSTKEN